MPSEISLQVLDWRRWPEVAPIWEHIHNSYPEASIFLCREWVDCWLETFGPSLKPELLAFRHEDEIVGCCLLVWRTRLVSGIPLRQVYLNCAGEDLADTTYIEFNSLLSLPGHEREVAASLAGYLKARAWDVFQMPGLLHRETGDYFAAILGTSEVVTKPSPIVDFARVRAKGGDYISGLSANTRSAIRRSQRSYEAIGGAVSVHFAQNPDEALAMLHQMAELHQATWTARGHAGCFSSAKFSQFHQQFIRRSFKHTLLARVQAGEEVTGILYCFLYRGWVFNYQSGFHYSLDRRRSPGKLTNYSIVAECLKREDLAGFDFMAGTDEYKKALSGDSGENTLYWFSVRRNTIASHLYYALRQLKRSMSRKPGPRPATEST